MSAQPEVRVALDDRPVLVLDFVAQYAQLIARRVRECRVRSELVPHDITPEQVLEKNPYGLILSGGPASIYADDAPQLNPRLLQLGIPVLGICYGMQAMAQALGGEVARTGTGEFGKTGLSVLGCGRIVVGAVTSLAGWGGGGGRLRWHSPWRFYVESHFNGLYGTRVEGIPALMDFGGSVGFRIGRRAPREGARARRRRAPPRVRERAHGRGVARAPSSRRGRVGRGRRRSARLSRALAQARRRRGRARAPVLDPHRDVHRVGDASIAQATT